MATETKYRNVNAGMKSLALWPSAVSATLKIASHTMNCARYRWMSSAKCAPSCESVDHFAGVTASHLMLDPEANSA